MPYREILVVGGLETFIILGGQIMSTNDKINGVCIKKLSLRCNDLFIT